jgi:hypothetical protein
MDNWVIDNMMNRLESIVRNFPVSYACQHEWGKIQEHPKYSSDPIYYQECRKCGLINPIGKK